MPIKRKTSLSVLDIAALIAEIKPAIVGAYLSKIYQIDEVFIFKLVTPEGNRRNLVLSPKHGFWLTKYRFEVPKMPPSFCQRLRQKLVRLKLVDLKQHDLDRVVFFKFGKYTLVLEVIRKGNLILLDENSRILLALRYAKMRDRDVLPMIQYKPPPPRGINVLEIDFEDLIKIIDKHSEKQVILAFLKILGLPKNIIGYILDKLGIDHETRVCSLTYEQLKVIYNELVELVKKCLNGATEPVIVYRNGELVGVFPYVPIMREGLSSKTFKSFNESVDEYFSSIVTSELEARVMEEWREKFEKLMRILEQQRKLKKEYEEEAKKLRRIADELYKAFYELDKIFEEFRRLKSSGCDWASIKERILELPMTSIRIVNVDPAGEEITIELYGVKIKLNLKRSVGENLSSLYEKAKNFERKCKRIDEEMKSTLNKIEKLKEKRKESERRVIIGIVSERKWYERFRWFISNKGFLVIAGKDKDQNEKIVRKYLDDNDIFLHANIHGAPVVVIKTHGKQVDEETLKEAAQFAASFSRAWELGFSAIDVYWVRGFQVSKSPPSGLYLPKGSFMIYGKRNYLKNVRLMLAIGVKLLNNEARILCGPVNFVKNECDRYIILVPGRVSRNELAKRIMSIFTKYIRRKYPQAKIRINLNDILSLLPRGGFFVLNEIGNT